MEQLFVDAPFTLASYGDYEDPIEGDTSYADNAAFKARALHAQMQRAGRPASVLADDSGLEVYALDRRPGVLTAYYGGADLPWTERRKKLLAEIETTPPGESTAARGSCARCTSSTTAAASSRRWGRSTARSRPRSAARPVSRSIRSFSIRRAGEDVRRDVGRGEEPRQPPGDRGRGLGRGGQPRRHRDARRPESKRPGLVRAGPSRIWCTAKDSNLQPID